LGKKGRPPGIADRKATLKVRDQRGTIADLAFCSGIAIVITLGVGQGSEKIPRSDSFAILPAAA
jgi:hypothetical protein